MLTSLLQVLGLTVDNNMSSHHLGLVQLAWYYINRNTGGEGKKVLCGRRAEEQGKGRDLLVGMKKGGGGGRVVKCMVD